MTGPAITACGIGREGQTLVTIDDFAPTPDALREAACASRFESAHHYPGIRSTLPDAYLREQLPLITKVLRSVFGRYGPVRVLDASFSIVTTPPDALSIAQRLPHCDAYSADRIALIHYLSLTSEEGTAFFRHRATGFETVNEARRQIYAERLAAELANADPLPQAYIASDTALFERIALAKARYNRALLYPSCLLHSGAIRSISSLDPTPETGRLTITGFLSVG
ncbi:MAG: hypothetical protein AVDCRST_MAG44-391 [uncultured Sphingomonas sp.]|uniref:Uncharacterized protein n=1 Tax=uncultured Sphingomonas sp. TaxID=158754 RepID=A0A6J4SAS7_9SPHN|nr:MAG: hypothetical protein AVDCRST_MAG44-391 [uncultured Sphingomonas sp.]